MGQPGFCQHFGKLATKGLKFQTMNSLDSTPDKLQCTYFRPPLASRTQKKKNSIPSLNNNTASDISDPYSDSESEADNRKNVTRWLESLPINEDWYEIEDDLSNRQGDFEKGATSNDESQLLKTTPKDEFDASQTSMNFQNNTPTISRDRKNAEIKFPKAKVPKKKKSLRKIESGKLKVHFKETPTEIRSEKSKYAKLLVRRESQLKNTDSKNLSTSDESNEDMKNVTKVEFKKIPYNLRSFASRKVERKIEARDSREKVKRCPRACSIRNQEYRRKLRGNSSAINQARRNEVFHHVEEEEAKPALKLKSPFTKQASGSRTSTLFIGTPCMTSYKLNELKEAKQNVQKLDKGKGKQKYVDRNVVVKSRLAKNKNLLKAVKDLVNVIDSGADSVVETEIRRKPRFRREETENLGLMRRDNELRTKSRTLNELKQKPRFINSTLGKKLDLSMQVALSKYKRAHENWEESENKVSSVYLEQPPRKKKKKPMF